MAGPENGAGEVNPDQPATDAPHGDPGPVWGTGDRSVTTADQVLASESSEAGQSKADNDESKTQQCSQPAPTRSWAEGLGGSWAVGGGPLDKAAREAPSSCILKEGGARSGAPSSSHRPEVC